jgi:hypothetical protein
VNATVKECPDSKLRHATMHGGNIIVDKVGVNTLRILYVWRSAGELIRWWKSVTYRIDDSNDEDWGRAPSGRKRRMPVLSPQGGAAKRRRSERGYRPY